MVRKVVGLFANLSQLLCTLLSQILVDLLCVLQELLDQILGGLIALLLRLANSVNCVRYSTSPHQIIGSRVDDVGHDAALSVIGGPDVGPIAPAPAGAIGNAITPAKSPAEPKTRAKARTKAAHALDLRLLF